MLGPSARQPAHVLQASGERVALALELLQAEQARPAEALRPDAEALGADARGADGDVRERRRDELRELALEPRDLRAQRAPRRALVDSLDGRGSTIDRQLLELAHASDSS